MASPKLDFPAPNPRPRPAPAPWGWILEVYCYFLPPFVFFCPPGPGPGAAWSLQPPPIKHIFPLSNSLFLKFFFTPSAQSCPVQNSGFSPRFPITLNSIALIPKFFLFFSNGFTTFRTFLFFFSPFNPFLGAQSAASLIYYHGSGISLSPYLLGSEEQPQTPGDPTPLSIRPSGLQPHPAAPAAVALFKGIFKANFFHLSRF